MLFFLYNVCRANPPMGIVYKYLVNDLVKYLLNELPLLLLVYDYLG
jgi:hypothetical protein